MTGTNDDAIYPSPDVDKNPIAFVDHILRPPRGSGLDGIALVNKLIAKTTGDNID